MLNNTYFTEVGRDIKGDDEYIGFKPKGYPMILYSLVDQSPLASVHFVSDDSNTIISKRPESFSQNCDFQGLMDANEKEFKLVVTNLCTTGRLCLNILKRGHDNTSFNGGSLNEINVIRPLQSCSVECDQMNNRKLILSMIEDKGKTITIKEAEEKSESKPKGTYFFMSVIPEDNQSMKDKFANTEWTCSDIFCIKRPKPIPQRQNFFENRTRGGQERGFTLSANVTSIGYSSLESSQIGNSGNVDRTMSRGFGESRHCDSRHVGINTGGQHLKNPNRSENFIAYKQNPEDTIPDEVGDMDTDMSDDMDMDDDFGMDMFGGSPEIMRGPGISNNPEGHNNMVPFYGSEERGKGGRRKKGGQSMMRPKPQNIMKSKASSIRYGDTMNVNSVKSSATFAYDLPAKKCILGLSVLEGMTFEKDLSMEECKEMFKTLVGEYVEGVSKGLLEKLTKIYGSEECVICMDELPDIVFYQCGHQCTHLACANQLREPKCPLCRGHIASKIVVDVNKENE